MSAVTDRGFDASWHPCEENAEAARALVRRLLAEDPELSGVVLHNEAVVEPVLRAFQDAGRRIPEDLSVVAICPDELAERSSVPLTAVALPATEIGEQAVTLLMAKLEDREVPDATLLPPHLTIRASTA
jgi:DNA-binding LacI/PurR family transcriptional regulator